jgi:hypothetical protein
MPETINSANAAASTLFLGHNGEWWDFWLIFAVIVAALSAIAIGVATTGSIVAHKREAAAAEIALQTFKLDTQEKISSADARAAEATKAAEAEKLERLKLEAKLAPRSLTQKEQEAISASLTQFKDTSLDVFIYGGGSADALPLAGMISSALTKAGWNVRIWNTISPGRWVRGVLVQTREGSDQSIEARAVALILSLRNILGNGVSGYEHFPISDVAPEGGIMGPPWDGKKQAPIRMLIGSKP